MNGEYGLLVAVWDDGSDSSYTKEKRGESKAVNFTATFILFPHKPQQFNLACNLPVSILREIAGSVGLGFTSEKETESEVCYLNSASIRPEFRTSFATQDATDYLYAVLHSSLYREAFEKVFTLSLPHLPLLKDTALFWRLAKLGAELRNLHLLASPIVSNSLIHYPVKEGSNRIETIKYEKEKVHINNTQYFTNVPLTVWAFPVGGCRPAQSWLSSRMGKELSGNDILYYSRIIVAISETERVRKAIDAAVVA